MAFRAFLDANILLDFTLKREGFPTAKKIIQKAIDGELQLFTSPAVIHITSYWTAKAYSTTITKQVVLSLLAEVHIIDCDHATALMALHSNIEDIEDALQYYTSLKHNIDFFISSDKKLKKAAIPQLPIYTAHELLGELNGTSPT
ncbi:MAG: type II toxin-antitoxin system VapC family toxin [Flavisolibacter sp.]